MKRDDDDGTIRPVLDALHVEDPGTLAMTDEGLVDLSEELGLSTEMVGDVPAGPNAPEPRPVHRPYRQMANATWRIFEEQRQSALEIARECADAIHVLEAKRDDALRTADMCVAGQKLGEDK